MDGVAPDEELLVAGADQVGGVARRVARARNGRDTGEDLAGLEQTPAILVRRHLLAPRLEVVPLLALGPLGHGGIVEPMHGLALMHDELGIRKVALAGVAVGQSR